MNPRQYSLILYVLYTLSGSEYTYVYQIPHNEEFIYGASIDRVATMILDVKFPYRATWRRTDRCAPSQRYRTGIEYASVPVAVGEASLDEAVTVATTYGGRGRKVLQNHFPLRAFFGSLYQPSLLEKGGKPRTIEWLKENVEKTSTTWGQSNYNAPWYTSKPRFDEKPTHVPIEISESDREDQESRIRNFFMDLLIVNDVVYEKVFEPVFEVNLSRIQEGIRVCMRKPMFSQTGYHYSLYFRLDQIDFARDWLKDNFNIDEIAFDPIRVSRPEFLNRPVELESVYESAHSLRSTLFSMAFGTSLKGIIDRYERCLASSTDREAETRIFIEKVEDYIDDFKLYDSDVKQVQNSYKMLRFSIDRYKKLLNNTDDLDLSNFASI